MIRWLVRKGVEYFLDELLASPRLGELLARMPCPTVVGESAPMRQAAPEENNSRAPERLAELAASLGEAHVVIGDVAPETRGAGERAVETLRQLNDLGD